MDSHGGSMEQRAQEEEEGRVETGPELGEVLLDGSHGQPFIGAR